MKSVKNKGRDGEGPKNPPTKKTDQRVRFGQYLSLKGTHERKGKDYSGGLHR
jgi:hypothetical protein